MAKRTDISWAKLNSSCWVQKQDQFIQGVVIQIHPLIVNTAEGNISDPKHIYQRSDDNYTQMDDLIDLTNLNEAELLNALVARYQQNLCQTFCGPQLVSLNPIIKGKQSLLQQMVLNSYNSMIEKSQSIIMTGELGSGKTETEKLCQYYIGRYGNLSQKLQAAQCILEAFGNSKTQRNPNSSRFGKVLTLHFDKESKMQGAKITTVAFEKTRVNSGEQNFHIFYQLLSHNQLNQFYIDIKQQTTTLKQDLKVTLDSLEIFNINTDAVLNIIASIIKLGTIQFDDHDTQCTITDQRSVIAISTMLGIHEKEFTRCLCSKTRQTAKNEIIDTPLSRIECINQQQNIIKYLYEKLFQYLEDSINHTLSPKIQTSFAINLVDMQGFEASQINNFEHLIINYIHEKLQYLYINQTFLSEMQLFQSEGLQYQHINAPYSNNQQIVDCFEKPPLGILNILDDSCAVAGTDETFLTKLKNVYLNHQVISFNKSNQPNFKIKHSPKEVEYNVIGFRIKNKDENNKQFQVILSKSKNATISTIYTHGLSNKYIGTVVRTSINDIMSILKDTENHFVRCIQPNEHTQINNAYILSQIRYMGIYECLKVRREGYAVRKTYQQFYQLIGNQTKKKNEYKQATQALLEKNFAFTADQVLYGNKRIFLKQQAFKVIQSQINKQNYIQESAAKKIQNAWICYKNAMIFRDFQCRVKFIQAHVKGYLQRQKYLRELQSIVFIQFQVRRFLEKQKYKKLLNSAIVIQTYFKRLQAIKYMIVEEQSVIKIQQFVRAKLLNQGREMEKYFKKLLAKTFDRAWKVIVFRAATKIQKIWKGYITRKNYDDNIQSIKLAGFLVQAERAAITIQKYVKRNQFRSYYLQMRQAAIYIQGWIRSRWLKNLFERIRYATIVIQRGVRKYFNQYKQKRKYQNQVLKPLENELNRIREQEFMNLHDNFIEQLLESEQENVPGKKIDLFSQVIDLEILTDVSEMYDTLWTSLYKRCFKECYEKQNFLSTITVGECHAYAGTLQNKVYSWGMNDQLQQGLLKQNPNKINQIQFTFKVKTIKSGANHGLLMSYDNVLYSTDDKMPLLKDVKLFGVYNDDNVAVDENNLIYIWKKKHKKPVELKSWTTFIRMSQLQQKISVHQISHGLQFMIVLSTNGLMFSMGENSVGELGINQGHSRTDLTLIELQDKIAEVHCGMKHSIAKSTLGKVYTWGWGQMGQLGQGNQKDEPFPKLVPLESKALQVMAGHKQSIVIVETRKIFWWGTNSCLSYQSKPVEYMINYPAIRVICSWSRTLSLVYVTFAKTYKSIDSNVKLKHKIINSLISKWSENDIFSIDPPYCESLANYFTQMKKPQVKTNIKFASKIEHQQLVKQLQQSPFNLLDDLKETNGFFSFKNESSMMLQKQLQEHTENTNVLQVQHTMIDNSNKLKLLKLVKKYKNEPQLQEIIKQSELSEILQYIN